MSVSEQSQEFPVQLPRRSRQGIVLGLDGWQVTVLIFAFTALVLTMNRIGPLGLFASMPVWVPLTLAAFSTIRGISTPKMTALWVMKHARHAVGATIQKYRPERVAQAGTVNLPGVRASTQLWDVDDIAAAYNPQARTISITAELEVQGFLMLDVPHRWDLARQWSRVLASFTTRPGVARVTLQERTLPTTIRAARDHYDDTRRHRGLDPDSPVAINYREVLDASERFAVAHRNYLTVTYDLVALNSQLKALGGGKQAATALARIEAGNLAHALDASHIHVRRWLTSRDIAALARVAFDPEFAAVVQNRDEEHAGVDPAGIGPMYLEEPRGQNGIVRTDSGVHTTMWIHEWPRQAAPVGFIDPIVFARMPTTGDAVTHILSIVLTPVPISKALKRIRDQKKVWRSNERMRDSRGSAGSEADAADLDALTSQERELVEGEGEFRYGGYLTVTAPDDDTLGEAVAGIRNALSRAGMEAQTLYCQQAEALMVNAIPLGLGMK